MALIDRLMNTTMSMKFCIIGTAAALLLPSVLAHAQPHPIQRGEDNVKIEIRYFAPQATRAAKLRIIPSAPGEVPGYSVWPMSAKAYAHAEPCWKSASDCEIARITVRTLYRLPLIGTWVDVTRFWCTRNADGQCELPAFAPLSVPPGQSLCATYDRTSAQWKVAPRICTAEDVGVPRSAIVTPTGVSAPHGAASLTDAQGAVWWLAPPRQDCEGAAAPAVMRDTVPVGAADGLRICNGVVWAVHDGTWYRSSATAQCGGAGWGRAQDVPPC